jgi:hypothetical protein
MKGILFYWIETAVVLKELAKKDASTISLSRVSFWTGLTFLRFCYYVPYNSCIGLFSIDNHIILYLVTIYFAPYVCASKFLIFVKYREP